MNAADETITEAAKALHANCFDSIANGLPWEDLTPSQVESVMARTRIIIAALRPALAAAWQAGRESGWDDIQLDYNTDRNPYE